MKSHEIYLSFIGVLLTCNCVLSLNILGVFPYQGKSHFFVFEPYLQELAKRGHNVTVISYFPQQKPLDNYHDISLAGKAEVLIGVFPIQRSYWTIIQIAFFLTDMGKENCEIMMADENVQNLWKSEANFDLVLMEEFNSECAVGLAYKLGAPVVGLTSHMLMPWHFEPYGVQYNPSYVSFMFLEGGTQPTLYQRIERVIFKAFVSYLYKNTIRSNQNTIQKYFDVPPLEELVLEKKFLLLYTNFVLTGSGLYPPIIKEVEGYHVAKPKELPADLKKFIDESKHGVIYISFGSMLRPDLTPQDKVEAIVGAISGLPQRIVWKWDGKLPGNPKNVYTSKWLPQNDILAHPNILAFYSHCGMLGTTEAIYHGVPVIGMPVFGDQPGNAAAVEESGLGVQIQIKDLTKDNLLQKIKTVLDPEFRRRVKELSRAWHDNPMSPMDTAIYWTEYAARNKNFTFRSPATTVPMYQYLYLDIFATVTVFVVGILYVLKQILSSWLGSKQTVDQNTLAKYIGDVPLLDDLAGDIKFLLVYHNFILTGSRLFPSNVIEVGGYHVTESKPLTGALKKFFDEAEHGIVYISFGSVVQASSMPADKVQEILEVMKQLPQRFVWKWEDQTLVYDKNKLHTASWLPQVDILAHPKTLAFVSHAGNGGTTEAIHYGVPMVAMPVLGDQPANAAAIEESGLGIQLQIRNLTKDNLLIALKKVLDPKFRQQVKKVSAAWHDRPMPPLDTAVFWTEFAAKHSNFTFRTAAADVPFYQHLNLDIVIVFIAMFSLIFVPYWKILFAICGRSIKERPVVTRKKAKRA
ncbi:UDP-glycosyltransferase UGT5-like [Anticarsia gemmatalis]|uniref:UDP-glycosyltransferase UGT5-like n=1 Tax=Anticarsia gemmatalis TaxID=129554 RepID=UPI003F76EC1D